MTNRNIVIEKNSANDDDIKLIELPIKQSQYIEEEQVVAVLEGSKTIFELTTPFSGYINFFYDTGDVLKIGDIVAEVCESVDNFTMKKPQKLDTTHDIKPSNFTTPAYRLLNKLNLTADIFNDEELVTTDTINQYQINQIDELVETHSSTINSTSQNKSILIVGAGKAASQLMSVFRAEPKNVVMGFLDDTEEKQGTTYLGLPILGKVDEISKVLDKYEVDSIICSAGNLELRRKVIELAAKHKLSLANAIHPSVVIDDNVTLGSGNYIGPNCFIGSNAKVGSGLFLSSNTIIEHDCELGNLITTGPSVSLSGSVSIKTGCVLGSGIIIEPYVTIGMNTHIASGCVIVSNIKPNSKLKKQTNYELS